MPLRRGNLICETSVVVSVAFSVYNLYKGWQVHYVFFARAGFTGAARAEAEAVGARLVDLETLDADLRQALAKA
jgi:hypothetical protein